MFMMYTRTLFVAVALVPAAKGHGTCRHPAANATTSTHRELLSVCMLSRCQDSAADTGATCPLLRHVESAGSNPYPTRLAGERDAAAPRATREHQDTRRGTVQTFATVLNEKELADTNLQFVSQHYDLVLLSFPYARVVTRLRRSNPDLIVLLFNNPYFAFGEKFWQAGPDEDLENVAGDWLLRDESGAVVRYNGPLYGGLDFEQRVPLMDIRVWAWQKYYAAQSAKWVREADMDGLFIDTLGEHPPHFAQAPGGASEHRKWRDSAYGLLHELKEAFAGTEALLCFNGISRPVGARQEKANRGLLRRCDGTTIEAFGITMGMDHSDEAKQWFFFETILKDLHSASADDKLVLIEVYAEQPTETNRMYALCSFLLVQNERTYFYHTSLSEAGTTQWRPEWSLDLGHPTDTYRRHNDMYFRRFEKATVWVNPQPETHVSPLAVAQIDPAGRHIRHVRLAPFSGTILFHENKKDDN